MSDENLIKKMSDYEGENMWFEDAGAYNGEPEWTTGINGEGPGRRG
jgi:hypothetical protein